MLEGAQQSITCLDCSAVLLQVLDDDAHSSKGSFATTTQHCFALKQGLSPQLDLARITFTQLTEQIHDLVAKYRTNHSMPGIKARVRLCTRQDTSLVFAHDTAAMQLQRMPIPCVRLNGPHCCR